MEILCLGGTGTVGSEVVERLKERDVSVRCMTRSAEKAGRISDGVHFLAGDLEAPASLGPVFEGVDRVHLLTPLHPDEATLGRNAIEAARNAGVGRIVLHSVHRVDDAPQVPHFASKIEMLETIRETGIPWVTIEPNNYYQNDLWVREAIVRHGIYPHPFGPVGCSRVDVRDIADATVSALLEDGHESRRYPVAGPEVLTGEEIARRWSRHLGREVRYAGDDLDAWEEASRPHMPEWLLHDVKIMFAHFVERGLRATDEDLELQARVLGHQPRSFDGFAKETVESWGVG